MVITDIGISNIPLSAKMSQILLFAFPVVFRKRKTLPFLSVRKKKPYTNILGIKVLIHSLSLKQYTIKNGLQCLDDNHARFLTIPSCIHWSIYLPINTVV